MIISESQMHAIENFFNSTGNPAEIEDKLFEMFRWYLLSDNEEDGTIPSSVKDDMLFTVREIVKLIREIQPVNVVHLRKVS